jgi:CheY-like chemotaxis protein
MAEKILLVDDEPNVLDGYRRTLGREFMLETAVSGQEALGPYRQGTVCRRGF